MKTATTIEQRARDLQSYIAKGRILEALDEFYDENVSMRENTDAPCVGRKANIEREKAWLATVKEFKRFKVLALAASGEHSFVESTMDYVDQNGQAVHTQQVSRATWKNGRIVDESFYHG